MPSLAAAPVVRGHSAFALGKRGLDNSLGNDSACESAWRYRRAQSEFWERPLGSSELHVVLTALSPDAEHLNSRCRAQGKSTSNRPEL